MQPLKFIVLFISMGVLISGCHNEDVEFAKSLAYGNNTPLPTTLTTAIYKLGDGGWVTFEKGGKLKLTQIKNDNIIEDEFKIVKIGEQTYVEYRSKGISVYFQLIFDRDKLYVNPFEMAGVRNALSNAGGLSCKVLSLIRKCPKRNLKYKIVKRNSGKKVQEMVHFFVEDVGRVRNFIKKNNRDENDMALMRIKSIRRFKEMSEAKERGEVISDKIAILNKITVSKEKFFSNLAKRFEKTNDGKICSVNQVLNHLRRYPSRNACGFTADGTPKAETRSDLLKIRRCIEVKGGGNFQKGNNIIENIVKENRYLDIGKLVIQKQNVGRFIDKKADEKIVCTKILGPFNKEMSTVSPHPQGKKLQLINGKLTLK